MVVVVDVDTGCAKWNLWVLRAIASMALTSFLANPRSRETSFSW